MADTLKIKIPKIEIEKTPEKTPVEIKETPPVKSEKENLLELYQTLKDLNIRSISDLENLIARAE